MEWASALAAGGSITADTAAYGDNRPIRFKSTRPWLMEIAPWLPWVDEPANNSKLLDYAPWASVMWWFFLQDDAIAMNDEALATNILNPVECEFVLQSFQAAGCATSGCTYASLTADVQSFATQKQLAESKLDSAKHLEQIDPGLARVQPKDAYSHIIKLKIREMADDSSQSYGPIGLVEIYGAPRLTVSSRYDKALPFMSVFKSLHRMHVKHDDDVAERIDEGENQNDAAMQDSFRMLAAEFFKTSEMPLAVITLPHLNYDKACTQRTMLFKAMVSWRFSPNTHEVTLGKYFISLVSNFPEIAAVVLPAPSAVVAKRLTAQLATAIFSPTTVVTYSLLASIESKLKQSAMTAEVKLPENASKSGQDKLAMLLTRDPTVVAAASSTGGASSAPSSDKTFNVTPEVQAWLNSTATMELEKKILFRLATHPPSYNAAVSAVSRSRMPLVIQTLTRRDHLGKSDAFRRGKEMRAQLRAVIAFFVSAHENTDTPPSLVQHDRVLCYETYMPDILFNAAFGSSKGDFHLFDPITIKTSVEQLRNRRKAETTVSTAAIKWGSVSENEAAAKYLDRYFHLLGWDNGMFTQYMSNPNEMLRSNSSLPSHEFAVLQRKVTTTVATGLKTLGKEWRTMLSTDSHLCPFPHEGSTLAPADSIFHKELSYIQERLDKLDEDNFWRDDEGVGAKQPPSTSTASKDLRIKNEALLKEIAGLKRKRTSLVDAGGSPRGTKSNASTTTSVVVHNKDKWTWNYGRSSIDEKTAAKAVGCNVHDYCWVLAAVSTIPPDPSILCPHIGTKGPGGVDHTDMDSKIHKDTLAKREDEDWRRKVQRCVKKRPLNLDEQQLAKANSSNTMGDGPTQWALIELYAGISAFACAAALLRLPVKLTHFTELPGPTANFTQDRYGAVNLGPTQSASYDGLRPDAVTITFECAPYTPSGLQKFALDPRSEQVQHSATALLQLLPKVFCLENVKEFFTMDHLPNHGMYTKFLKAVEPHYTVSAPQYIQDTEAGGTLFRTRGFLFGRKADEHTHLPQWDLSVQPSSPACSAALLQPKHELDPDLFVHGDFQQTRDITQATGSTSPIVVGTILWGGASTPLQPGVIVKWNGGRYKVDDPSKTNPGMVRLIKEQPPHIKRHEQRYVPRRKITPQMHQGRKYPVFTLFAALKSPRGWGQLPEGNMCLILDIRYSPPAVRRLSPWEQYKQMNSSIDAATQVVIWNQMKAHTQSAAALTRMLAGSLTSTMSSWAMKLMASHLQQELQLQHWHNEVPQQRADASGMGNKTKRVVMIIFSLWPTPSVLLALDHSTPSCDFTDSHRGHEPAQTLAEKWSSTLQLPSAPFVVGEIAHEGDYTSAYIPVAAPVESTHIWNAPTGATWVHPDECTGIMAIIVSTTIAKAETFVRATTLSQHPQGVRTGAKEMTSVLSLPSAPMTPTQPFEIALKKGEHANAMLRKALLSEPYVAALQVQVDSLCSFAPETLQVASLLSSWVDRVRPQPLTDLPDCFQTLDVELYTAKAYQMLPFVHFCDPDATQWMPLPPAQQPVEGFDPQSEADLYIDFPSIEQKFNAWEALQQQSLSSYAELKQQGVRASKKVLVFPESARKPEARDKVYDLTTPTPTLVDFHAPIDTNINLAFVSYLVNIQAPQDKTQLPDNPSAATFPDLELVSDLFLGARSKAPMPHQSVFCPHGESLRMNLEAIEDQALDLADRNWASLHETRPYSPTRYISNGTTERKDDPNKPRLTDNKSAPLKPFLDADGTQVTSQNVAYTEFGNLPPDPKEKKVAIHHIAQDASTLRHAADIAHEPVYICSFDMKMFFDQVPIPFHERHLNMRMLRPKSQFRAADTSAWNSPSTHMAHKRLGFGASRNSNVGQRLANLIVHAVSYFMDILERPHHASLAGYLAEWLQQRQALNDDLFYRQDRLYASHMYTDDLIGLTLTLRTTLNFITAVYLMATNMNVLLAGMHKMQVGTGLRVIGGTVLVILGVVAIPSHKRLHGIQQLRTVLAGQCTYENYEKLVGLLVHCLILTCMQFSLLDDLYKPLAYMKRSRQGPQNKLNPDNHPYLIGTWRKWLHTLSTCSAARFSAAMGNYHPDVVQAASIHLYGDAFHTQTASALSAGIGGFNEGAWWHYAVDEIDAQVLDITKLEGLVIPCNFIVFNDRLPTPASPASDDHHGNIVVHGDGLASIANLPKSRVQNSEMRVIKDLTTSLPQYSSRAASVIAAHTYGLGNIADAPSRNLVQAVIDTCRALGIRPRLVATPPSVPALIKLAAARIRAMTPEERSSAKSKRRKHHKEPPPHTESRPLSPDEMSASAAFSCNSMGDGPDPIPCMRTPTKRAEERSVATSTGQMSVPATMPNALPPDTCVRLPVFRSPPKRKLMQTETVHATRSPPQKKAAPSVSAYRTLSLHGALHSAKQLPAYTKGKKATALTELIVTAYPPESPYAINPSNMLAFEDMVEAAADSIQDGIPDSTESHERSAVNRYWIPFCSEVGMSPMRPPYSTLTPIQRRAEDNMRAIFLLWAHARMKGIKHDKASPNSVMSVLRHIINMLDRENDEKSFSPKPKLVLTGMLTRHVAEYGPLLPDQSLAPPKAVITALLNLPQGTKLGSYTLDWTSPEMIDFKAMYEASLQSGTRLEEVAVGIKKTYDKRKMSKRSLMWRIDNKIIVIPNRAQLLSLSVPRNDGALLLPACSKADKWGNKHGHKPMFFPYNPTHIWNAASSLRDMELKRPMMDEKERETTPLFRNDKGDPFEATRARTLLHYMYSHPSVIAVTPKEHITQKGTPKYSFHSGRKLFATSLAKAGADRPRIQSMARWLCPESVDLYDQLSLDDNGKYVTAAYNNCPNSITPALLKKMKHIPIDDNDSYIAWAVECHVEVEAFKPDW